MKKLFLLAFALFSFASFAQTDSTSNYQGYVSMGLSTRAQGDFAYNSYPSVEIGVTHQSISYGAVFGRGNLVDTFRHDQFADYFWEVKVSPSYSIGALTGSLIAGGGAYFDSTHYFSELGVGVSYSVNSFTYGVTFSNWDTLNYVTPYVSYSF